MLGRSTADGIFTEVPGCKQGTLHCLCGPCRGLRDVIWWVISKLEIDEWQDIGSRVRVGDGYCQDFGIAGIHQALSLVGSCLPSC